MKLQFECPACGGLIDYPAIDKIIDEYDPSESDIYYYEDVFEDELMVVCDWCKKLVEVPLELPAAIPPIDPLKHFDKQDNTKTTAGQMPQWPSPFIGKFILGTLLFIYGFNIFGSVIVVLVYFILWFIGVKVDP